MPAARRVGHYPQLHWRFPGIPAELTVLAREDLTPESKEVVPPVS